MNTIEKISFRATKAECVLIGKIVKRACGIAQKHGVDYPVTDCNMDLTACNANGMRLDMKKLLDFPDFDFSHDVFGIRRHIDRNTGKIQDFFVPRCAKK